MLATAADRSHVVMMLCRDAEEEMEDNDNKRIARIAAASGLLQVKFSLTSESSRACRANSSAAPSAYEINPCKVASAISLSLPPPSVERHNKPKPASITS